MTNLGLLFKEWREAVEKVSKNFNKPQLLLTAAVYYSSVFRSLSYPAEAMENNLDWINVMAFDFGAPTWKPNLTEAPAALYNPFSEAIAKFVCYWRALRPLTRVFRLIFQKFVCLS